MESVQRSSRSLKEKVARGAQKRKISEQLSRLRLQSTSAR
jgi:hypothetical protein